MTESPFADRIPVFIGDDVGDEEGFRRVNRCGGHSFKVGIGDTAARFCFSDVGAVLAWLGEYADWLNEQCVASGAKQKETSERIRS